MIQFFHKFKRINFKKAGLVSGLLLVLLIVVGFLMPETASAELSMLEEFVATAFSWVVYGLVWVIGQLIFVVVWILVEIAQYNDFINAGAVEKGWSIVRDLCNMFFILMLMIVAFGTILRIPGYGIKNLLAKIVILAILINFSRLICGLIIDFSQVIMLTFVNAFKEVGGGNIIHMLGIDQLLSLDTDNNDAVTVWSLLGTYILALLYALISLVVMVAILGVLVMRMVMLWVYIILSPFAYLLGTLPATQGYSKMWWTQFTRNVVVGPVLAFFIWLSLATVGSYNTDEEFNEAVLGKYKNDAPGMKLDSNSMPSVGKTGKIGTVDHMMRFIISISLLIGGLTVTQQIGGAAGSAAGKAMGTLKSGASWMKKKGRAVGKRTAQATGVAAVPAYFKQRRAAIDKRWEDKTQGRAAAIAGGVGMAKAATIGRAGKFISGKWGNFGGNQAKKLREQVQESKINKKNLENREGYVYRDLKKKYGKNGVASEETSDAKKDYIKNRTASFDGDDYVHKNSRWEDAKGNGVSDDKMDELISEELAKKEADQVAEALGENIGNNETKADRLEKRQSLFNKIGKAGMIAGGALTGGALGGIAAVIAGAAGGGVLNLKSMKGADSIDRKIASDYRSKKVGDAKEKFKDGDDSDVLSAMDDIDKTVYDRMGAVMEAMSRGLLDSGQIRGYRGKLQEGLGGSKDDLDMPDSDIKLWKDKKVGSRFEALASKTQGSTGLFYKADKNNKDIDDLTRGRANDSISAMIKNSTLKLKDMDVDAIASSIDEMSSVLSDSAFVKQYKESSVSQQSATKGALSKSTTYDSKSKYAHVTDIKKAFGNDTSGAETFVKKLSVEELSDIINKSNDAKRDGLYDTVGKDKTKINDVVLRLDSASAKSIKKFLDIMPPEKKGKKGKRV